MKGKSEDGVEGKQLDIGRWTLDVGRWTLDVGRWRCFGLQVSGDNGET